MHQYFESIKSTSLLSPLPDETIQAYFGSGKFKLVRYKKGEPVHIEGETCNKLEIIISGRVAVEHVDEAGNFITISEFYKDDILSGNLLFSKSPVYPMTVSTHSDCLILEIEREVLFDLLCKNSGFLRRYLEFVSERSFILGDKTKQLVKRTIREKIMSWLDSECERQNSEHITPNMTKKAFAEIIGVQRTSLSRELAKMKNDGLISFDSHSITRLPKP